MPEEIPAELAVTRASTGWVFELRARRPAARPLHALPRRRRASRRGSTLREYQATSPDSDELTTPYLVDDRLDLSAWARDSLVLALPDKILCRPDCAGLCPVCGKDLNAEPHEHGEKEPDPRWAALSKLKEEL